MASNYIYDNVDPNANIIFGALVDERLGDKVKITVLATGFDANGKPPALPMAAKKDVPKEAMATASSTNVAPTPAITVPTSTSQKEPVLQQATASAPTSNTPPPPTPPSTQQDQSFLQSFRRM